MDTLRRGEPKLVTLTAGHEPAAGVEAERTCWAAAGAVGTVWDDERLSVSAVDHWWLGGFAGSRAEGARDRDRLLENSAAPLAGVWR